MESTNNSPDVSHSSLRLSERLATPYRSFSNLRGFGKLGTEICSHEKNPEVSHSSPPSRFSQASGSPPLLSYGGSCPHRAAHLHRRTQRRTAPVFLCPGSGSACEAGTCAAHRDRVPRVARVSTAPPSCPHAPSGVRKAADGQPLSVGWCTGCGGVCKLH